MFTLPDGVKALNLPEQVQKNIDDIASLNTALDTKQDSSNAVTTDNLADHIKNIDLTEHDLSTNTLEASESITDSGTLSVEGKAEFGGDVEVDGSVTLNSPDDVKFKTGSLDFSDLTSFIDTYYANAGRYLFANKKFIVSSASGTNEINISGYWYQGSSYFSRLTNITGMFMGASCWRIPYLGQGEPVQHTDDAILVLPDFGTLGPSAYAFAGCAFGTVRLGNMTVGNAYGGYGVFGGNYYVKRIEIQDGKTVALNGYQNSAFRDDYQLEYIGAIDLSGATDIWSLFTNCSSLKEIHCTHWKISFDISASTAFEESDLVTILNHLDSVTTTQTLTMGSTNLAKLTNDDILIATGKGWVLS